MYSVKCIFPWDGKLILEIPQRYRDNEWANQNGPLIQKSIADLIASNAGGDAELIVDFRDCRWIDPLPSMSLLLEISYAANRGVRVSLLLPEVTEQSPEEAPAPYPHSASKLLLFLKQEGFLENLDQQGVSNLVEYDRDAIDRLDSYTIIPSYRHATCIKMQVVEIDSGTASTTFAYEKASQLIDTIGNKLGDKVTPHQRDLLLHKLRAVIQESLQNTHEHAYDEDARHYDVAIYVRYRDGGLRQDAGNRTSFADHVLEEQRHCPMLHPEWLENCPGCLEVFILDRGMGIVRSFSRRGHRIKGNKKFLKWMQETFVYGRSTKSADQRDTAYGGLHLMHKLLTASGDYIRGLDDGIWFGAKTPIPEDRKAKLKHALTKHETRMLGLAMHYRLGWKAENDTGKHWASFAKGTSSELWRELCYDENECKPSFDWYGRQIVIDDRFRQPINVPDEKSDWALWLVEPHKMKWDVVKRVSEISEHVKDHSILVIADIQSYEAPTYVAAFEEMRVLAETHAWPRKFKKIFLCTDRWRFSALEYTQDGLSHGYSMLNTTEMTSWKSLIPPDLLPAPKNFRLMLVRWIKWHDSLQFWNEIRSHKSLFIAENVIWSKEKNQMIAGYLDFDRALRNFRCMRILRISLRRIMGIMPMHFAEMQPIDQLVGPVISEVNISDVYEPAETKPPTQLLVGSVLVSGATMGTTAKDKAHLHFFVHGSSPWHGRESALLFWDSNVAIADGKSAFERIGKTAIVAKGGWKSLEVPRYSADCKQIGHRSPQETYRDLQIENPVIYKAGHWRYEGHHDFLTVNIAEAAATAFMEMNELAKFLLTEILPFIGITPIEIEERVWSRLHKNEQDLFRQKINQGGFLVYRSHPCTEFIMRRLLQTLTTDGISKALSRVFPVPPIRTRWGGSALLIPPLIRDEIREAIKAQSMGKGAATPSILTFDDAAITGRTMHDLRAALTAVGTVNIRSLVILNRMRQPADGIGGDFVRYYWRLDVPTMGREGNCPLCHAINLAKELKDSIPSKYYSDILNDWINHWEPVPTLSNWPRGLTPLRLHNPEKGIDFCYRREIDIFLAKIDILRSTGLSTHASEIHAMTSRDDYFIKKLERHSEPAVRIEIAASQLLLFGDEYAQDIRIELIRVLMSEVVKLKVDDAHAFLSGLATLHGISLFNDAEKKAIAPIADGVSWSSSSNYSSRALLAYLVKAQIIDDSSQHFETAKRLLKTDHFDLAKRFRNIFREIRSIHGNAHSEAIPSLVNKIRTTGSCSNGELMSAADSAGYLHELILGIPSSYSIEGGRSRLTNDLKRMITVSNRYLGLAYGRKTIHPSDRLRKHFAGVVKRAESFLALTKSIMSAFFFQIEDAGQYCHYELKFESVIQDVFDRIDWELAAAGKKRADGSTAIETHRRHIFFEPGEIGFSSRAKEVWIPWNHGIQRMITDLLRNTVYADHASANPFAHNPGTVRAHLWVKVDMLEKHIRITFANAIALGDIAYTRQRITTRTDWESIREIGGSVKPTICDRGIVRVEVEMPYASYLLDHAQGNGR